MRTTNSGRPQVNPDDAPVPDSETRPDGQHVDHWVLPEDERAKGFVRPVRLTYRHVGIPGPAHPLRDLSDEERALYADQGYVKFEAYPESERPVTGKFWAQADLDEVGKGCGMVTSMPVAIGETYARLPAYYGSTFCCYCGKYLPVGKWGEFVWEGTGERVGT